MKYTCSLYLYNYGVDFHYIQLTQHEVTERVLSHYIQLTQHEVTKRVLSA